MSWGYLTESRIGFTAGPEYGGPEILEPSAMWRGAVLDTCLSVKEGEKAATCCHRQKKKKREEKLNWDERYFFGTPVFELLARVCTELTESPMASECSFFHHGGVAIGCVTPLYLTHGSSSIAHTRANKFWRLEVAFQRARNIDQILFSSRCWDLNSRKKVINWYLIILNFRFSFIFR